MTTFTSRTKNILYITFKFVTTLSLHTLRYAAHPIICQDRHVCHTLNTITILHHVATKGGLWPWNYSHFLFKCLCIDFSILFRNCSDGMAFAVRNEFQNCNAFVKNTMNAIGVNVKSLVSYIPNRKTNRCCSFSGGQKHVAKQIFYWY